MNNTRSVRTNLNCSACVAAIRPLLDNEPSIASWRVDTTSPDKTLTIQSSEADAATVRRLVERAGFRMWGEIALPSDRVQDRNGRASRLQAPGPPGDMETTSAGATAQADRDSITGLQSLESGPPGQLTLKTYFPLLLLAAFLVGLTGLIELRWAALDWSRAMQNFMGAFFLTFSFFKLLDLRGFASAFQMYDVVAKRWPGYALAYPFLELLLGIAYITGFYPSFTQGATLLLMSVSIVGVIQSLLTKRRIRCACLGAVFNLPMSTVTLVEDGLMIAMAAVGLIGLPH